MLQEREQLQPIQRGAKDQPGVTYGPIPRRWHRCRRLGYGRCEGYAFDLCPCGAVSVQGRPWYGRNSRRG